MYIDSLNIFCFILGNNAFILDLRNPQSCVFGFVFLMFVNTLWKQRQRTQFALLLVDCLQGLQH